MDALAIAAAIAQPWSSIVLSGAATAAQLKSNLHAVEITLDKDERDELMGFAEPPEDYWTKRSVLTWN
jgi:aryl-alcohol dehydrogenase-like predicted oxidoreductase